MVMWCDLPYSVPSLTELLDILARQTMVVMGSNPRVWESFQSQDLVTRIQVARIVVALVVPVV